VAHGEVLNRIVHTEMVKNAKALCTNQRGDCGREISSTGALAASTAAPPIRTLVRTTGRGPLVLRCRSPMRRPRVPGEHDYESDSSHASTSSTRSTTSTRLSCGLPSYEKHVRCRRHRPFVFLFRAKKKTSTDISVHQFTIIITLSPQAGWVPSPDSIDHQGGSTLLAVAPWLRLARGWARFRGWNSCYC